MMKRFTLQFCNDAKIHSPILQWPKAVQSFSERFTLQFCNDGKIHSPRVRLAHRQGAGHLTLTLESGLPRFLESEMKIGKCKKCVLNNIELNRIQDIAINEKKEVGGVIDFNSETNIKILFTGTDDRIDLNLESDTADMKNIILFHTHPKDEDVEYDPPSILDIISFLSFNVKSIADLVLNRDKADISKILKIQCSLVFTKNEVYTYYFSHDLIMNITNDLLQVFRENEDEFIERVERILEEIELNYTFSLRKFNKTMNEEEIGEYFKVLNSLGFLIHRSSYRKSECYTF